MGSEDLEEMKPPASFDLLSRILHFGNEDEENWWYSTAPMFAHMMADAGYDIHMQYRWLYFHKEYIIPALGPYPKKGHPMPWKSILTRHGPPFELSFNFTKSLVRSAFEPIGPLTGTDRDPFNSKMIWDVLEKLRPVVPGLDLQRFTHFIRELTTSEEEAHTILSQKSPISAYRTQNKLAADINPNGDILMKTYIYPDIKASVIGVSTQELRSFEKSTMTGGFLLLCLH